MSNALRYSGKKVQLALAGVAAMMLGGCAETAQLTDPLSNSFKTATRVDTTPTASMAAPQAPNLDPSNFFAEAFKPFGDAPVAAPAQPVRPPRVAAIPAPSAAPFAVQSAPLAPPSIAAAPIPSASIPSSAPVSIARSAPGSVGGWTSAGGVPVVVAQGETAESIATRFGVPTATLLSLNGMANRGQVQPGTRLTIPVYHATGAATASVAPALAAPKAALAAPKAALAAETAKQTGSLQAQTNALQGQAKSAQAQVNTLQGQAASLQGQAKSAQDQAKSAQAQVKSAQAQTDAASKALKLAEAKKLSEAKAAQMKIIEVRAAELKAKELQKAEVAKLEAEKARAVKDAAAKQVAALKTPAAKAAAVKTAEAAAVVQADSFVPAKPANGKQQVAAVAPAPATLTPAAPAPAGKFQASAPAAATPAPAPADTTASVPESANPEFRWPARCRVIQGFGSGGNDGINIAVPEGTQVKAAEGGVVAYAGSELKGYGNLVLIRHPNGFVTAYANNGSINVKRGESVKRGQTIALSGQTGNVASPQLHFELRKGQKPVDPSSYLAGL
jgi:murein DD-endopeptidase MepM/ murein hydrolase activator NlpD